MSKQDNTQALKGKQKNGLYSSKKAKMMIAAAVATSSFAVGAVVEQGNEAEASTMYNWSKYTSTMQTTYSLDTLKTESIPSISETISGQTSYSFDPKTGNISLKGNSEYIHYGRYGTIFTMVNGHLTEYRYTEQNGLIMTIYRTMSYTDYGKGDFVSSLVAEQNAYTNNGRHSDGFWYERGALVPSNVAPNKPTLTVPPVQFEHGDKHIIGMNSTDPNGDAITLTLQVAYDDGAWKDFYTGTAKTVEYTVPNDKTSVKFRAIASDGKLSSTSAESATKSIQEVMYYWSKYNDKTAFEEQWTNYVESKVTDVTGYTGYTFNEDTGKLIYTGTTQSIKAGPYTRGKKLYSQFNINGVVEYREYYVMDDILLSPLYYHKILKPTKINKMGSFIETLEGTENSFSDGVKNSDGFWYVRGQRVLDEDITPPIIELEEQEEYGNTSTITVKTHDLGTVSKVKWAVGEQDIVYFNSNGTEIGIGQTTPSNFTVSENGIYTVYAVDNKGNAAVQTIDVTKINLPAEIQGITTDKFNVLDDLTTFEVNGTYTDREENDVTVSVTSNSQNSGSGSGTGGTFSATVNGANLANGVHENPFSITLNDGVVDGTSVQTTDHIVVKVDDAADYTANLNAHTNDADSYTKAQHEAFYNAYETVAKYETSREQADLTAAQNAIDTVKTETGISESTTLTNWNDRLAIVETTVALEKAESSLVKADFEAVQALYDGLSQANKDVLADRMADLTQYHFTSDLLLPMESKIGNKEEFFAYVNSEKISEVRTNVAQTKTAAYKSDLNKRLNKVIQYFLNNNDSSTPEDLIEGGGEIIHPDPSVPLSDEKLNGIYNDLKPAFEPLVKDNGNGTNDYTNAQQLLNVTVALRKAMMNLDEPTVTDYKNVVATAISKSADVKADQLATVTSALESLLAHRTDFVEDTNKVADTASSIANMTIGTSYIAPYFTNMNTAIKEVSEYNFIDFDENHSDAEKEEGQTAIDALWATSKFQSDMQVYLDNGIPDIQVADNKYEYIHNGTLTITGSIVDANDTEHEVTVTLGADTKTANVTDGNFTMDFTLPIGYTADAIKVVAKDQLTEKKVTITGKPMVHVADVAVFTDMVKALEIDRNEGFEVMNGATISELVTILDTTELVAANPTPSTVSALMASIEMLSTQDNGKLETLVREIIQTKYLKWLYDNHSTTTVEDFETAGVLKDGQPVVTSDNLIALQTVVTDYKASDLSTTTPTVTDYINWTDMLASLPALDTEIESVYALQSVDAVETAITKVDAKINDTIPTWSSLHTTYDAKLADLENYKSALGALIKAETSYAQDDLDVAQGLVDAVQNVDAKQALQNRIDALQATIDAITGAIQAVILAETELANNNNDAAKNASELAQGLVDALIDGTGKTQLQDRLNEVNAVLTARDSVANLENDVMALSVTDAKIAFDATQALVNVIQSQTEKDSLNARLDEVQDIINAKQAIDNAAQAIINEDTALIVQALVDAQAKIDVVETAQANQELQNQLDNLDQLATVLQAVIVAETSEQQADVEMAKPLVDGLVEGSAKDSLNNRLNEVQKVIDGRTAVEVVENTLSRTDYNDAVTKVEAIDDSKATKAGLQDRLNDVLALIEAIEAVEQAENSKTQADKDKAQELVDALPDSPKKDELLDRLEDVQNAIDKKSTEDKAEDAVSKAEETWNTDDVTDAQNLIDVLTDETVKQELQDRLDHVNDLIDAYNKANDAVTKAEEEKTVSNVADAQKAIDDLVALAGGTNEKTDALQDRLDKVNDYVVAEKAVERAESLLTQGSKDAAQQKVDILDDGAEKDALQERLDKVQELIGGKGSDLLDKIIDNPQDITGEELAEYVDPEPIYEELLDDYRDALEDLVNNNDTITKEDVIKVIRFINSLALAKREMTESTIAAYDSEYNVVAPLLTMSNYPTPVFLETIEQYVDDDSALTGLVSIIASETGMNEASVLEVINNMQVVKEDVQLGSYSIEYVDENGELVQKDTFTNVPFGEVILEPALKGYEIVANETDVYTFELAEDTEGQVFKFTVKASEEVETGSYTAKYVNELGELIHTDTVTDVPFGEVTVTPVLEGYEIIESESNVYTFELTADTNESVFTYTVKALDKVEEVQTGSYTVEYVDAENNVLFTEEVTDVEFGSVSVAASLDELHAYLAEQGLEGTYELEGDGEKIIELSAENEKATVTFNVALVVAETPVVEGGGGNTAPTENTESTEDGSEESETNNSEVSEPTENEVVEGQEQAQEQQEKTPVIEEPTEVAEPTEGDATQAAYRTIKIASLGDGLVLTATTNVFDDGLMISNEHANYLTKAFLALEGTKTAGKQGADLTEQYLEQVKSYIVSNLLDGAYKEMLLAQLGLNIVDIGNGDDGIPDLTQIIPVKPTPPVVEPTQPKPVEPPVKPVEPIEPPVVIEPTPPVIGGGGGTVVTPPVITPVQPPVEEVKPPVVEKGDNHLTENHTDDDYNWTLENPTGDEYVFEADGIKITVPINDFKDAAKLEVSWIHLGNEHYKLFVKVDGKEVNVFSKQVKFEKEHHSAYLVRSVDGSYEAMPHNYRNGQFNFKTYMIKSPFYFSLEHKTFKDIDGLYSEEQIENLASRYIVQGKSADIYEPHGNMTRAQFSAMISRALGLTELLEVGKQAVQLANVSELSERSVLSNTSALKFADVTGHWASRDIQALHVAGIVQGKTADTFDPNSELTRNQAALMVYRLLQEQGVSLPVANPNFKDIKGVAVGSELYKAIGSLQALGIFEGYKGNFMGSDKLIRTQMAKVLERALLQTDSY